MFLDMEIRIERKTLVKIVFVGYRTTENTILQTKIDRNGQPKWTGIQTEKF